MHNLKTKLVRSTDQQTAAQKRLRVEVNVSTYDTTRYLFNIITADKP